MHRASAGSAGYTKEVTMNKRHIAQGLMAFGIFLVMSGESMADDTKAYHGAICAPSLGSRTGFTRDIDGFTYTANLLNDVVVCPLVRDRIDAVTSLSNVAIEVFNAQDFDQSFMQVVVYTQTEDTGGTTYGSEGAETNTYGNRQFSGLNPPTYNGNEGSYMARVVMSTGDKIYHVHVRESTSVGSN